MKAAVLTKRGREGLDVRHYEDPTPAPGEAVMKLHAAS